MWPDRRLLDLAEISLPLIQAPMAGANGADMAIAVSASGGLGSIPCAMLDRDQASEALAQYRQSTARPVNVNFFCHQVPVPDAARDAAWRRHLQQYYAELGLSVPGAPAGAMSRSPFNAAMCELVEECRPEIVSFHFDLPERPLVDRVKAAGCVMIGSATTVDEARWLEDHGCDAVIAQGFEAGGHRGMFLTDNIDTQIGTFALLPQVVDAVNVPVIAAGGIGDRRGIAAAFALGAAGAQIGTAYLFTAESLVTDLHRAALHAACADQTALTNVFSGRPARGVMNRIMREIGPMSDLAPAFPTAGAALAPLKASAEASGSADFSQHWCGQAVRLGREMGAAGLTQQLAAEAMQCMQALRSSG